MASPLAKEYPQPAFFLDQTLVEDVAKLPITPDENDPSRLNSYLYGLEELASMVELPQDAVERAILFVSNNSPYWIAEYPLWQIRVLADLDPYSVRQDLLEDISKAGLTDAERFSINE